MKRILPGWTRLRPALVRHDVGAYQSERARPILIRQSGIGDEAGLERLAALDSRKLPEGSFLLAEVDGELVAAASLDIDDEEPLSDPFRPTANLRELLRLEAAHVRRHRDALARPETAPVRDLRKAA
jgi:hypothetical protein